jgi:hypothetical protein
VIRIENRLAGLSCQQKSINYTAGNLRDFQKPLTRIYPKGASPNPKAAQANAREYVDPRFVKEFEDSGFIKGLYRK